MTDCRYCKAPLEVTFADLGLSPLANAYVEPEATTRGETFHPLHAYVCSLCHLVQLEEFESPEQIFGDYAYFSSYSSSWLEHCERYAETMVAELDLGERSRVVEIASNDGYLLQYFKAHHISVLGIEPAANVAAQAIAGGIPTIVEFFGRRNAASIAERHGRADLLVANNVLAHVPDIVDFVAAMKTMLAPGGTITIEFPHLLEMMRHNQFDTIYHEHFSYLSLTVVAGLLTDHDLRVLDVTEWPTHGGSLRVFAGHRDDERTDSAAQSRVDSVLMRENEYGLNCIECYDDFARRVVNTKLDLLEFLIDAKRQGQRVVGYGAPAKGNTLLNYCGIGPELLAYTVDRSPHKQGRLLPGTRIPVRSPDVLRNERPDSILILPWNLKDEIIGQLDDLRQLGTRFVTPIPTVEVTR